MLILNNSANHRNYRASFARKQKEKKQPATLEGHIKKGLRRGAKIGAAAGILYGGSLGYGIGRQGGLS
jgi:hypothetical protein